jgi:hypothetical protein
MNPPRTNLIPHTIDILQADGRQIIFVCDNYSLCKKDSKQFQRYIHAPSAADIAIRLSQYTKVSLPAIHNRLPTLATIA